MRRLTTICAIVTLLLAVGSAKADLSNGSFETGDLTGWSTFIFIPEEEGGVDDQYGPGDVQVVTSHKDVTSDDEGTLTGTGTTSWLQTDGDYFALLKAGAVDSHVQLYQTFAASAGDTLTFDYFWDSWDDWSEDTHTIFNDTGTGKLLSGSVTYSVTGEVTGGDELSTLFYHSVSTDEEFYWGTPWTRVSYMFADAGTYTLLIETWNDIDNCAPGHVGIDNVALSPVPVPGAVLLGLLGLSVAGMKLRKHA